MGQFAALNGDMPNELSGAANWLAVASQLLLTGIRHKCCHLLFTGLHLTDAMFDFRKLRIWQEGYALTLQVYQATRSFPRDELFGLTSQMRRAANSIPHNIAEGCGRNSRPELLRFVVIAMGSASELESEVLVAQGLGFLEPIVAETLLEHTGRLRRMLTAYYQKVKAGPISSVALSA